MDTASNCLNLFSNRRYLECIAYISQLSAVQNPEHQKSLFLLKLACEIMVKRPVIDALQTFQDDPIELSKYYETKKQAPKTSSNRPVDRSLGRPITGISRNGANVPGASTSGGRLKTANWQQRPATASIMKMISSEFGSLDLDPSKIDKLLENEQVAKLLFLHFFHMDNVPLRALDLTKKILDNSEKPNDWWKFQQAKCYLRLNKLDECERMLVDLNGENEDVEIAMWLAKLYMTSNRPDKAELTLKKAINVDPSFKQLRLSLSQIYEEQGRWDDCSKTLTRLVENDPTDAESIVILGTNYFYDEQPELAKMCYERLLDLGHNYSSAIWNNYGLSKFYCGELEGIEDCFDQAINLCSNDAERSDIWFNLSHIALNCGDLEWARNCLRLTVHYEPGHAEAYNNMAVIGMPGQPVENLLQQCRKHGPQLLEPYYNSALYEISLGRLETALSFARKAKHNNHNHFAKSDIIESLIAEINEL